MEGTGWYYYTGVFAALVAAGLGLPIPEEIPVLTGGALCGQAASRPPVDDWPCAALGVPMGDAAPIATAVYGAVGRADVVARDHAPRKHPFWWIMLPVCFAGVVISDGFLYGIGRFGGPRLLDSRWVRRLLKPEKRAEIFDNLHKHGVKILLGARFLPGIRAPIFVAAGIIHLPFRKFLLADGLYAIPGVTLLFTLAFWSADAIETLIHYAVYYERIIGPLIVLGAAAAVGGYYLHSYLRRGVDTGDPKEVPIIPKIGETIAHIGGHMHLPHHEHGKHSPPNPPNPGPEKPTGDSKPPKPNPHSASRDGPVPPPDPKEPRPSPPQPGGS